MSSSGGGKEFLGFPIPAAAGLVASLTLFLMKLDEAGFVKGNWRYVLPVILVFLSIMMISEVKYPSFKKLDLRATRPFTKTVVAILFIGSLVILQDRVLPFVLPFVFTGYLIYGFIRPRISRQMRREIEDEDEDEPMEPLE
jgi:CDP-diacylglycerol--serine O-phosphatidyltransferase